MLVREQPLLCVAAKMDICYAIYIGNKYISTHWSERTGSRRLPNSKANVPINKPYRFTELCVNPNLLQK